MATRKRSSKRSTPATKSRIRKAPASHRKAGRPARPASRPARSRKNRRRRDPQTLRLRSTSPGFTVSDLNRSISFYTDVLGFIISERWTDGGTLKGVMLKAGVCELGLSQDDWAKGRDRKRGEAVRVWFETAQDVDALAAHVKAAGLALAHEPTDEPWGARSFSLDDPDGFHLTFFKEG
jgi:catechol 2,3-dioxygenase-like lactoylglutathione lyase family enzyme